MRNNTVEREIEFGPGAWAPAPVRVSFTIAAVATTIVLLAVGASSRIELSLLVSTTVLALVLWAGVAFDAYVQRCSRAPQLRRDSQLVLVASRPSSEPPRPSGAGHRAQHDQAA